MRRDPQSQRTSGGKATSTDISAAVQCNHFSITFVHHRVCFSNAVFHAERVKRKPHITAGLAAELAHHRQVALIGADHHAAAKEVEDRALGRLRILSHDQAGKAVYRDRFIICLTVGGRKTPRCRFCFSISFRSTSSGKANAFFAPESLYTLRKMQRYS